MVVSYLISLEAMYSQGVVDYYMVVYYVEILRQEL
jgi:hypothetical protein